MDTERMRDVVRGRPLLLVAAAGALGIVFGGVVFTRLARFMFVASAGYLANELWHRQGRLGVDQIVGRLPR
jgi:hypothetical protein